MVLLMLAHDVLEKIESEVGGSSLSFAQYSKSTLRRIKPPVPLLTDSVR